MKSHKHQKAGSRPISNCHTHIFHIDHVPNKFGKTFLPWPLYHWLSITAIKWYYQNLTTRGSTSYRRLLHQVRKLRFRFYDILKFTYILWWIFSLLRVVFKWITKVMTNLIRLDQMVGPEFKELYQRYLTLARYSTNYKSQRKIFEYLTKNYPPGTQYVVLSMDMDWMGAGHAKIPYLKQLEDLRQLALRKENLLPFIFADPRRIQSTTKKVGTANYLKYTKSLLGKKQFNGIKIYPALGYYPFDKNLIALYEFSIERQIPIMTHCMKGTVFYRGKKESAWNAHPIIYYNKKQGEHCPIPLPQKRNYDFTTNFSHPLNYECLLNPSLLSSYLRREIDLSKLKICFAHFGGSDEWEKYRSDAWTDYNNNISPIAMEEYLQKKNTLNHGSKRTIWWNASWLSIIYDLLVKYENTYTDVSFILHNEDLFPMLKYLLQDEKVRHKILFGTDYYVVSQKGLDKDLYQKLRSYLDEDLFNLIARENPSRYLTTSY